MKLISNFYIIFHHLFSVGITFTIDYESEETIMQMHLFV